MSDISDLDKKSVLVELVHHLRHLPEVDILDPRMAPGYNRERFVKTANRTMQTKWQDVFSGADYSGAVERSPIFIGTKSGKLEFLVMANASQLQAANTDTIIGSNIISDAFDDRQNQHLQKKYPGGVSANSRTGAYAALQEETENRRDALLKQLPEYALLTRILGEEALASASFDYSKAGLTNSEIIFSVQIEPDWSKVSIEQMLERSQGIKNEKSAEIQRILRTRIGVSADDLHHHIQPMPEEQAIQFLTATLAGVLSRRYPGQFETQQQVAAKLGDQLGTLTKQMEEDAKVLQFAAQASEGAANPKQRKTFLENPLFKTHLKGATGADVLLQMLGDEGIAHMPANFQALAQPRLRALNAGDTDSIPALTLPGRDNASAGHAANIKPKGPRKR